MPLPQVSESTLKDNFDIVYQVSFSPSQKVELKPLETSSPFSPFLLLVQLLEEMLDEGSPLTTQSNILRDIVLPPSLLNKVLSVAGVSGFVRRLPLPSSLEADLSFSLISLPSDSALLLCTNLSRARYLGDGQESNTSAMRSSSTSSRAWTSCWIGELFSLRWVVSTND